jgi:hypothetical protein
MRNVLPASLLLFVIAACSPEPTKPDASDTTVLFEGGEELIHLYHILPGAAPLASNSMLVEALSAARTGKFRNAATRAIGQDGSFEKQDEASLIVEKVKQDPPQWETVRFVAIPSNVTVQPYDVRDRRIRICWERTCKHNDPVLEERVANYILRISLPSPQGIDIAPDEDVARTLEAEASDNSWHILRATYIAEIEGADPVAVTGGMPFFQIRARLVKLRIAHGNPMDTDATADEIYHSPPIYDISF